MFVFRVLAAGHYLRHSRILSVGTYRLIQALGRHIRLPSKVAFG